MEKEGGCGGPDEVSDPTLCLIVDCNLSPQINFIGSLSSFDGSRCQLFCCFPQKTHAFGGFFPASKHDKPMDGPCIHSLKVGAPESLQVSAKPCVSHENSATKGVTKVIN